MISFEDARARILAAVSPRESEAVTLDRAVRRFLANDVCARWDLPPYDNSAMDGYAICAASVSQASSDEPTRLAITERIYADSAPGAEVGLGQAARIMTGAPVPPGADAVVRQEDCSEAEGEVRVRVKVEVGRNIRRRGGDTLAGDILVPAGERITPNILGVLATFGHQQVEVGPRPRVALLAMGDELLPVERASAEGIVESNSYVLRAQARDAGAELRWLGLAPDKTDVVADLLSDCAAEMDVVVTIAGSSVGERDPMKSVFEQLGVEIGFWNVAMKPGKPVGFGVLGRTLFLALPGNPVSASTSFELLVRPALLALQGARQVRRPVVRARLLEGVRQRPGRTGFMRAYARAQQGDCVVEIPGRQSSGRVTLGMGANALAVLPAERESFEAGELIDVLVLGDLGAGDESMMAAGDPPRRGEHAS